MLFLGAAAKSVGRIGRAQAGLVDAGPTPGAICRRTGVIPAQHLGGALGAHAAACRRCRLQQQYRRARLDLRRALPKTSMPEKPTMRRAVWCDAVRHTAPSWCLGKPSAVLVSSSRIVRRRVVEGSARRRVPQRAPAAAIARSRGDTRTTGSRRVALTRDRRIGHGSDVGHQRRQRALARSGHCRRRRSHAAATSWPGLPPACRSWLAPSVCAFLSQRSSPACCGDVQAAARRRCARAARPRRFWPLCVGALAQFFRCWAAITRPRSRLA